MIPGIPRLRFPDFSVRISPVDPKRRGVPCNIALLIKLHITVIISILFGLLLFAYKMYFILEEEFASDYEEKDYTGQYIGKVSVKTEL